MESEYRLKEICERYGIEPDIVRSVIKSAFPKPTFFFFKSSERKPQAYLLAKSLKVLQTYLATQEIDLMIEWAYKE